MSAKRFLTIANLVLIIAMGFAMLGLQTSQASAAFTLPAGAVVTKATLSFYVSNTSTEPASVFRVTQAWTEMGVTWNNFHGGNPASGYATPAVGHFTPSAVGWVNVDVTGLVQGWIANPATNFGVLLSQDSVNNQVFAAFYSSENGSLVPRLTIEYTANGTPGTLVIQRPGGIVEDAYIWESLPDTNRGGDPYLYTGYVFTMVKHSLIRFEMPTIPVVAALGDRVWFDTDRDGVQDNGELGVPNVTVNLYVCGSASVLATQHTNANGYYLFSGLTPGNYYVEFVKPAGYTFSPQDQGGNDALDSDANVVTGIAACTNLSAGETDLTWDAGLYKVVYGPGTGTPGYWKNHPEAWPVSSITIGGVEYTKEQALYWLGQNDKLDKTITMFRSLVAAVLNTLIGNASSCIAGTIEAAQAWMVAYGPVGSGVLASSAAWKLGEPLYLKLDMYNNGFLCAMARD